MSAWALGAVSVMINLAEKRKGGIAPARLNIAN
jgi:hypothetical protein